MTPDTILIDPSMPIGDTVYITGDKIDVDSLVSKGLLTYDLVATLTGHRRFAPASAESFRIAIARRPAGSPWPPRGFTQAYLEAQGWVTPQDVPAPVPAPKAKPGKPAPSKPAAQQTHIELTKDALRLGPYRLQPHKNGRFTLWTATDADGRILRAKSFNNQDKGIEYLRGLVESTAKPATDTPGAPASESTETNDGGDIQPGAGDQSGPGAPEDR